MTLEQAIDSVFELAASQGEPLTRDVCEQIVMKLFERPGLDVILQPGDIAKLYRERYEFCIICANGNDLPEGESCPSCGRKGQKGFPL